MPFSTIATVATGNAGDTITHTDTDVLPGHHYVYRISQSGPEGTQLWWQANRNATTGAAIPRAPLETGPPTYTTVCPISTAVSGSSYSYQLHSTASLPSWALASGALPAGLSLASNGTISGTPSGTAGTYNFSALVTDDDVDAESNLDCSMALQDAEAPPGNPPMITTLCPLSGGQVGTVYAPQTLTADGDTPISWSITAGALPSGLSLASGVIQGTPTAPGVSAFSLRAENSAGFANLADCQIAVTSSEKARFIGTINGTVN